MTSQDQLHAAILLARDASRSKQVLVEEFKQGAELSVDVVVHSGIARIVMISENIKLKANADSFTIVQNVTTANLHDLYCSCVLPIAQQIAEAFDVENGPMLIQLIAATDGLYVVEFSSRIGGGSKHHFIKKMTGFDILTNFVDLLTGQTVHFESTSMRHAVGAMNYVYAHPGIFQGLGHVEYLKAAGMIEETYLYKTPGMRIHGHSVSSDRTAGFLVLAPNRRELQEAIGIADDELEVRDDSGSDIMLHGVYGQ